MKFDRTRLREQASKLLKAGVFKKGSADGIATFLTIGNSPFPLESLSARDRPFSV
jgi:hypothetical protein